MTQPSLGFINFRVTRIVIVLLGGVFLSTSCSTLKDSVGVGIGTGMALGAAQGAALSSKDKHQGAAIGAAIGGVVGAVSSYLIHGKLKKRDAKVRKDTLFNLDRYGVMGRKNSSSSSLPAVSFPTIEEDYIDTHVQGKKLIEGHRVWTITEDSQWLLDGNSKYRPKRKKK